MDPVKERSKAVTFTATTVPGLNLLPNAPPSFRTPLCTWAMLPEATGVCSKSEKMSSMLRLKACSIVYCVKAYEWEGAPLCSLVKALQMSGGNRSGRVAAHCSKPKEIRQATRSCILSAH